MEEINIGDRYISKKALTTLSEISKIYFINKEYFIKSEELLEGLNFFIAPLMEHRACLDHMMRYFNKIDASNESQLEKALAHEIRAFFDVADYICIGIREYISKRLNRLRKNYIKKIWTEYLSQKERIYNSSLEIAEIRNNRNGNLDSIEKYKYQLDEMLEIYKDFINKIEPKLRIKSR